MPIMELNLMSWIHYAFEWTRLLTSATYWFQMIFFRMLGMH